MSKYDEYMDKFHIKNNGTLLSVFENEIRVKKLGDSSKDTDERIRIRLNILKRHYSEIHQDPNFDEAKYRAILAELEEYKKSAYEQC